MADRKLYRTTTALLGVLSTPRPRQKALVSQLYPYFFEDTLRALDELYAVELTFIPDPRKFLDVTESLVASDSLYAVLLREVQVRIDVLESLSADDQVYSLELKRVLVPIFLGEVLSASDSLFIAQLLPVGIYLEPSEILQANDSLFEANLL